MWMTAHALLLSLLSQSFKELFLHCSQAKCFRESGCKGKGFYITVQEFRELFAGKALFLTLVCNSTVFRTAYTLLYNAGFTGKGGRLYCGKRQETKDGFQTLISFFSNTDSTDKTDAPRPSSSMKSPTDLTEFRRAARRTNGTAPPPYRSCTEEELWTV